MKQYDVIVVGGGASGLICAATAAERGLSVAVLDPNNKPGRKVRITGKGRCNVTNQCDIKTFMSHIPGDGRFLYSAVSRFSPEDTYQYFEGAGVPLKVERGFRVFPQSDNANDIADCLWDRCRANNVAFFKTKATALLTENGRISGVKTWEETMRADSVVVCTGGLSYPLTGTTGDGYRFAKSFGHTVINPKPSLIALNSSDEYCAAMQGFSLKNVGLRAYADDKLIFSQLGEMLFTHFGVSGPLVLSSSAHMRDFEHEKYRIEIDLKPGLDEKKLDARILRDFDKYKNREFGNALSDLLGHAIIPTVIQLSGIPEETPVHSVTREQRMNLIRIIKAFPVAITGTRPIDEAIVTAGGINTAEINPRTMESKLMPGLFFAGEVLNLDAYTGGFNLQIAWSTGHLAGMSVRKGE